MGLVNINTQTGKKSPKGLNSLAGDGRKVEAMKGSEDRRQRNAMPVEASGGRSRRDYCSTSADSRLFSCQLSLYYVRSCFKM